MDIIGCDEAGLIGELEVQAPTLWRLIMSIMTPGFNRQHSKDHARIVGMHDGYFIMNHILKIRGANILIARAARVGIFLETQGILFYLEL